VVGGSRQSVGGTKVKLSVVNRPRYGWRDTSAGQGATWEFSWAGPS
jgi:hypothetical protein